MLIPIDWLKQFVQTKNQDKEIAEILSLSGTNVEDVNNGVLNCEITANRPDCLSVYGVAREYACFSKLPLKALEIPTFDSKNENIVSINIQNPHICPRYSAYVLKNAKINSTPDFIKERIQKAGMRSLNLFIDITNYIMLETGQPLHAFDIEKIKNGQMLIRQANNKEVVVTLDNIKRNLDENAIVIENDNKLIDLAGIMGGKLSEISKNISSILLQAAIFDPILIRRTSKKINLTTEASYRYERGVDIENTKNCLSLAAKLFIEYANAEIVQTIDIYPNPVQTNKIRWSLQKAESLLGISLDINKCINELNSLKVYTKQIKENELESEIPTFRFDLKIPEDIFEELARFYPLNSLPRTTLPKISPPAEDSIYLFTEYIKDQLIDLGFTEIYGYSFLSPKDLSLTLTDPKNCRKILNPLSHDHQYLRPFLLPDMLIAISRNPSFDNIQLFEIGNVFSQKSEQTNLGIIIAGKTSSNLKDIFSIFLKKIQSNIDFQIHDIPENILSLLKIRKKNAKYLEVNIENLKKSSSLKEFKILIPKINQKYSSIAKFPSATRDISFIVNKSVLSENLNNEIIKVNPIITNVILFDEYESEKFGPNNKSLAYHIFYQSSEKSLTDKEVTEIHNQIVEMLKHKFNATLRK